MTKKSHFHFLIRFNPTRQRNIAHADGRLEQRRRAALLFFVPGGVTFYVTFKAARTANMAPLIKHNQIIALRSAAHPYASRQHFERKRNLPRNFP
jgi:hypothetical protein